jgi:hypothetical protein
VTRERRRRRRRRRRGGGNLWRRRRKWRRKDLKANAVKEGSERHRATLV